MVKNIILIGAGESSGEAEWLIEACNKKEKQYYFLGFVDDTNTGNKILGTTDWLIQEKERLEKEHGPIYLACTIGNTAIRKMLCTKLEKKYPFATLIHPDALVHASARIGDGVIILSGCTVSIHTTVEKHVYLNFDVLLAHDCVVGAYSNLSPKTSLMGGVIVGEGNHFGASVVAIPHTKVGDNNIFGAGCVITKDFESQATIVGVPAKVIKKHNT